MNNYFTGSSLLGKLGYFPSLFLSPTEMKQRILVVVSLIDRQTRLEPSITRIILRLFLSFAFTKSLRDHHRLRLTLNQLLVKKREEMIFLSEGFSTSVLKGVLHGESLMIYSIKGLQIAFLLRSFCTTTPTKAHGRGPYSDDGDINKNVKNATCCNVRRRNFLSVFELEFYFQEFNSIW